MTKKTEREVAKKTGVNRSLVGRKRRQGKTDKQIAEEAASKVSQRNAAMAKKLLADIDGMTFAEAQRRKEAALAKLREFELREREGRLVSIEDAGREWDKLVMVCRSRLLAIPSKLSPLLYGLEITEIQAALKDEIWNALTELSEYDPVARETKKTTPKGKK